MTVKIKRSLGSTVFDLVNTITLVALGSLMVYPFLWVISTSISSPFFLTRDTVKLFPVGIQFKIYARILGYNDLAISYGNTIKYAVLGTIIALIITSLSAYTLSIKSYRPRKVIMLIFMLTMFFYGGMIPTYLLIKGLGMLDTIWAIVLPPAMNLWFILILRTSFSSVPEEIRESARIDGASEFRVYWQIIMPVSKAALATIALFACTNHWNSFFAPLIYLNDEKKYPLTIFLRDLVISRSSTFAGSISFRMARNEYGNADIAGGIAASIRAASIVVTILPIVFVYPFVQKYFVRGVMLGSIKS